MNKLVVFSLLGGDLNHGFPVVTAQLWDINQPYPMKFKGSLPSSPELPELYRKWQMLYEALHQRLSLHRRIKVHSQDVTNISVTEFGDVCQQLQKYINQWLNSEPFQNIVQQLRTQLGPDDEIRVIIETDVPLLHRLPWHLWNFFEDYSNAEVALSTQYERPRLLPRSPTGRVKILAILGNSEGIDVDKDRFLLKELPGTQTEFFVEPTRKELNEQLWNRDWDILFFAGHSASQADGATGEIYINQTESLTIPQLRNALQTAIARGLKLAIFNSCDGIGLARNLADLNIPQIIVMREPVPDLVAQEFLKNFLAAFAGGRSFYCAAREARERLQGLENDFPCASWLPVTYQNPTFVPITWQELCGLAQKTAYPSDGNRELDVLQSVNELSLTKNQALTREKYRQRQVLLSKVKQFWIENVLEKSLHQQALIELNLEERLSAVSSPSHGVEDFSNSSEQSFPLGIEVTDVFNRMGVGRTLLILGEPGSGKTTILLRLAQNLIARAEEDSSEPLPVVFNLSAWVGNGRRSSNQDAESSLAEWLVKELHNKYQVSKTIGRAWIDTQGLLLLLDGLDEVKAEHRETCVEAINYFIQEHGQTELAICCRVQDYEALSARLVLRSAIYAQCLTPEQIAKYLDRAGPELAALKTLLQENPWLQELAQSPLMLSVMSLAYQGVSVTDIPTGSLLEECRSQLLNAYIKRVLERKQSTRIYPNLSTMQWLTYLAQRMAQESQTIFLIEEMQSTWLTRKQTWIYRISAGLTIGLLIVLAASLGSWLGDCIPLGDQWANLLSLLAAFPLLNDRLLLTTFGIIAGLIVGLKRTIEPTETLKWSWVRAWSGLVVGWRQWSSIGLRYGTYSGLVIGLIGTLLANPLLSTTLTVSPALAISTQVGVIAGMIVGMIAGITAGVIAGPQVWLNDGFSPLKSRLKRTAICGMIAGLSVGLSDGGLLGSIAVALSLGSIAGFSRGINDRLVFKLTGALITGLVSGIIVGLGNGGVTWLIGVLLLKVLPHGLFNIWRFDGLSIGVTVGFMVELIARLTKTQPVSTLQDGEDRNWMLDSIGKGLRVGLAAALISGLILGVLLGLHQFFIVQVITLLISGLGFGLLFTLTVSTFAAFVSGISGALMGGQLGALLGGLSSGLTSPNIELSTIPNQGIWRSIRSVSMFALVSALTLGLFFGTTNWLAGTLFYGVVPRFGEWLHFWLTNGLFFAVLGGLIPGTACVQHLILRLILWQSGAIPWNYTQFLDYATNRILLQKVGGGYIFIHRILLDHFTQRQIRQ